MHVKQSESALSQTQQQKIQKHGRARVGFEPESLRFHLVFREFRPWDPWRHRAVAPLNRYARHSVTINGSEMNIVDNK